MSFEPAAANQTSTNPWVGSAPSSGEFSTGQDQGNHREVTVGRDQTGATTQPAAKDAVKSQGGGQDSKSPPPYYPSREQLIEDVQKDPSKFNLPPGMPPAAFAQQYFNEFVAKLACKDPFAADAQGNQLPYDPKNAGKVWSPQEKEMLQKWGYNPEVPKGNIVDDNNKSGLYGLRIEPLKGSGAPPIVAFRGTEPGAGPQDLQSDLGGKYVGQSQYEGNLQQINERLSRPGDKNVDVVGYSLGGALAQKYAVEHAQQVGQLSTFQAPGIGQGDADRFKEANADGHIDVNHFYNDADIVHRAGAAKLDGSFHQVKNPNFSATDKATLKPHLTSIITNSNADFQGAVGQNNIQTYDSDPQKDRGFLEGARRTLGPAASGFLGGAYAPVVSGAGDIGQGFSDAKRGGSEIAHGVGDLLHHPLAGLGEIGHGLLNTATGVGEGFLGAAKIGGGLLAGVGGAGAAVLKQGAGLIGQGWDGAKNLASKAWDGTKNLASNAWEGTKNVASNAWDGTKNLASKAWDGTKNLASSAWDGTKNLASNAWDGTKNVASNAWDGTKNLASKGWDGAKNLASSAGNAVANTASTIKNAAGNALSSTGKAISNGASAVKKFLRLPW